MSGTNVDVWHEVAKDQDSRGNASTLYATGAAESKAQPDHKDSTTSSDRHPSKPVQCLTATLPSSSDAPQDLSDKPDFLGEDQTPSEHAEPAESPETKSAVNFRSG